MYKLYKSSMARYMDLKVEEFHTCLSPRVHFILCDAGVSDADSALHILDDRNLLNWKTIETLLPEYTSDSYEYFCESARSLAPAFRVSHDHMTSLTPEQFSRKYAQWLQWTSVPQVLQHCFELVKNGGDSRPIESLLLSSAVLERSLGDVFLLKAKQCPSMLKDLLLTSELRHMFGPTVIKLLRALIGPPISLNIRNVLWHGFPSPGEISPRYSMFMVHVTVSLGYLLEQRGITPDDVTHRPLLTFPMAHTLQFAQLNVECEIHSLLLNVFRQSTFVLPQMFVFWTRALELYSKHRYDESIVLLLPQLEHALRRVFAAANNCPGRVITAENNALFTTFDEILHHVLEDGSSNMLRHYIGAGHVSMLLDLLMYPEGPRIRDRLSHGECRLLFDQQTQHCSEHVQLSAQHHSTTDKSIKHENVSQSFIDHSEHAEQLSEQTVGLVKLQNDWLGKGENVAESLSTGEIFVNKSNENSCDNSDLVQQWEHLANHVIGVSVSLSLMFLADDNLMTSHAYLQHISDTAVCYKSTFHPLCLLQTELVQSARALSQWARIERPRDEEMEVTHAWTGQCIELDGELLAASKTVMFHSQMFMTDSNLNHFLQPFSPLEKLVDVHSFEFDTLYRYKSNVCDVTRDVTQPSTGDVTETHISDVSESSGEARVQSKEEEIVGLLRRILSVMRETSAQVLTLCAQRHIQWKEKCLRSRQRNTYARMLNTIPELSSGVRLAMLLVVSFLYKIHENTKWPPEDLLKYVKFVKWILQYSENLKTYTSADKNRWDEALKLSRQLYVKCATRL